MLEITSDDIAHLNDEQLRTLVARLCEAEVRSHGLSASFVTWGGNQTAPDGGIDVRVALPIDLTITGFVPRASTGFQVKQQDMPQASILEEMRPKGRVRPTIQHLADQAGAYIIVSSEGSTTDYVLANRRKAMADAVAGIPNVNALTLDFYDRTRVATWVRGHAGLIPWVKKTIGRAIPGWQSYGSWAYAPASVTADYLLDDTLRLHQGKREAAGGLPISQGIRQMRDQLRKEQHVVRLVGLSGVGKTRLVQALFDERIGEQSLDPSVAIYTNMADGPDPQPIGLASNLIALGTRAILIIDNCPPDLHHRLSELCRQSKSNVSLITIEYDIREDQPEGTEVFTLEPSSPELIQKLIRQHFSGVSEIDSRAIAEFSGGNSRIAMALATTVGQNETLAGLSDEQLFQRLFLQRHVHEENVYLAAQTCSLVYSFQGADVCETNCAELFSLAKIIGKSSQELYRSIAELQRRDLVQQRSVWRAVLPQAIANQLAAVALQNIPYAVLDQHLVSGAPERLLKSFSRRLGYLHISNEAVTIVKKWLAQEGLLGNVAEFDELRRQMFRNIAPVAPGDALVALEKVLLRSNDERVAQECKEYLDLLSSLAYEIALFDRCVALIVNIAVSGRVDEQSHPVKVFVSLFCLFLSGTHATVEQRLRTVEQLLGSTEAKRRALGALALKGLLEAQYFHSSAGFSFGARSRDYGYWPCNKEEVQHWFRSTLKLVEAVACSNDLSALDVRAALAEKFHGLWNCGGVCDELANVSRAISRTRFWPEGWIAVRQTIEFDKEQLNPELRAQLRELEAQLRPVDLPQKVRSIVFSGRFYGVDLCDFEDDSADDIETRIARTEALARDLGKAVATDEVCFGELLNEVVSSDGQLWSFGQGLLEGAADVEVMWRYLVNASSAVEEGRRKPQVLAGFVYQLRQLNPAFANVLLDEAVEDCTLAQCYPYLQVCYGIDDEGVIRLKRSLVLGKTPVEMYDRLAYGRAADPISALDLKEILLAIAAKPFGYDVATEILQMRLHSDKGRTDKIASELIEAGCELMLQLTFTKKNHQREDYRLSVIVKHCLLGNRGASVVEMEGVQKIV